MLIPLPPTLSPSLACHHSVLFDEHQRNSVRVHKDDKCECCAAERALVHLASRVNMCVSTGAEDTLNGPFSVSLKRVQCSPLSLSPSVCPSSLSPFQWLAKLLPSASGSPPGLHEFK